MNVQATIDGQPVELTDWQCDSAVNWGYRSLTGEIPESVTWAEQESPITLWLDDGTELWAGKLAADPDTTQGKRSISARGYAEDISSSKTRMFYRQDGGEQFTDAEGDPHNYGDISDKIDAEAGQGRLVYRTTPDKAYTIGEQNALALWVDGAIITQVSYAMRKNGNQGNMDIYTNRATGPSGTGTNVNIFSVGVGNPDGTVNTFTISSPEDLITIALRVNTAFTPTLRQKFWLTSLKVYGRTTDDAFSISDVVADVGADAGFSTTGVEQVSTPALPLDWTEDHTALLSYMAELADWHWEALGLDGGVPRLLFGPWDTVWTGYQASGIRTDWEAQKRFNRVRVPFRYLSGVAGEAEAVADPDPFPGKEVVFYADELETPQPDAALATSVAAAQVAYRSAVRVAGRVTIGRVTDPHGEPSSGYKVRPGHLMNVAERPDLGPQRIVAMTYRERENVVAEINDDFSVVRLLADLRSDRPRARRKQKPRRKKG